MVNIVRRIASIARYTSPLRTEQAAETRRRVIDAAAALFASEGYARTTLGRIATAADVSVETVQAQGAKRSLLGAAVRRLSFGREVDESILAAPEARELVAASTPAEFTRAAAALQGRLNAATHGLWRAFGSAAADDPAIDEEWSAIMALIRRNLREIVDLLAERGWLRADVDLDELTAGLWILGSAGTFEKLTVRLGWSERRYRAWLGRSIADLLFE